MCENRIYTYTACIQYLNTNGTEFIRVADQVNGTINANAEVYTFVEQLDEDFGLQGNNMNENQTNNSGIQNQDPDAALLTSKFPNKSNQEQEIDTYICPGNTFTNQN